MPQLKRKPKDDLKADEIKFLQLLAETDEIKQSAKVAFPNQKAPERKAHRLLEHPKAQELLKQCREHIARQLEEKFKYQSTNLLHKVLRQADGQIPTKKIVKTFEGHEIETHEHYDQLGAIEQVMKISGRIDNRIQVNTQVNTQQNNVNSMDEFKKALDERLQDKRAN